MKRNKKIIVLLIVLAVVCVAALITKHVEDRKEQIENTDEVILEVEPDSVNALAWSYDDTSLSFHKEDDVWKWDEDDAFPVNENRMNELLSVFSDLGASFIIEDVEDYSQYGLDAPTCTITLSTEEQDYEIQLGAFSTMDSERYVSIGDGNVYLVSTDPFDTYNIELSDTIQNDVTPSAESVESIQFSGEENYEIDRVEDSTDSYCESDEYFTVQDGETVPLDTENVDDYYGVISNLNLTDYISYNVTEEELSAWGLDDPELTVSIHYMDEDEQGNKTEQTFVLSVGRNQEELAAEIKAEEKGDEYTDTVTAYVRVGESPIVYQITSAQYDSLIAASYNDLRHEEVLSADIEKVTQMDVTLEGTTYTILSEEADDEEDGRTYSYNGEEIDAAKMKSCISNLVITDFKDKQPTEKEEVGIVFHLDNENYPEVSVSAYRYDGTSCMIVLDGKPIGLVERTKVVDLIEAVNAVVLG